jgi:hypothetical protein
VDPLEVALLVAGMVGPIILALGVFFSRKHRWATWAKTVFVTACLVGLLWGILGFIVWPPVHVTRQTYALLLSLKNMCAGFLIGSLLSVIIARPYEKRASANSNEDPQRAGLTNR